MANKTFRNFGLIRTNNLSDVEDSRESLTNVLNDLVSGDLKFTAEDLDPIQGISNTNVRSSDFQKLAGITVEQSTANENQEIITQTASPFITIKNRIDQVIQTTDDPPFFNGGDGLKAEFWEEENIASTLTKTSTGDDIFIEPSQSQLTPFWTTGYFQFSNTLDETLAGSNGGIQWSGFYIPNQTGNTDFIFNVSGFFMLELENTSGVMEVAKSIYDFEITLASLTDVDNDNVIEISAQDYKHAASGAAFNPDNSSGILVSDVNWDSEAGTYQLVLNSPVSLTQNETFTLSYSDRIGIEAYQVYYPFRNLASYSPREIRITYWFPGNEQYSFKVLDANFRINDNSISDLQFWNLYTVSPEENSDSETFKNFFNNRLLVSGGTVGDSQVSSSSEYESVESISPLLVKYTPPKTFDDILRAQYTYSRETDSDILSVTSTSPLTANLEIGNIAVGDGIPLETSITQVSTNNVVVLNQSVSSGVTSQVDFLEHRGLVKITEATNNTTTVTVADTDTLQPGMIVVTRSNTDYVRITNIVDSTTFETDIDLALTETENIFIYLSKGIENRTLNNFCIGVYGKETEGSGTVVLQDETVLPLNNTTDLAVDMVVQSSGFIPEDTTVTAIDTADDTVTISNPVLEDMISGITVVFAPAGTTLNKEQCIIPLNTAPPFTGTDTGLATTGNVLLTNSDSQLNVVSLNADNAPVSILDNTEPSYNQKIQIQVNGSPFYILGLS